EWVCLTFSEVLHSNYTYTYFEKWGRTVLL
ncbi:unnamed protein product, partial [marine sediment metagenome]